MIDPQLSVRPMRLDDVRIRISYFHDATDEYLRHLGVDRALLPTPDEWFESYARDYSRPLPDRQTYGVIWEVDGHAAGFSTIDRIHFGEEAFMHLHVLDASNRKLGLGTQFVRLSVGHYFGVLELHHLYCEPNALNVAPNRTLQKAGFRYLFSNEATPSPINFLQLTTRWVFERDWLCNDQRGASS